MSESFEPKASKLDYKCYLMNVRSHRDYVCLEIDNCPSDRNLPGEYENSLDSSRIAIPVSTKIRFNIKYKNNLDKFWFDDNLEIYAEGHQIYPNNYCPKCENSDDKFKDKTDPRPYNKKIYILNNRLVEKEDKEVETDFSENELCLGHRFSRYPSKDNLIIKDIIDKNKFKCKSEMLTIEPEYSSDHIIKSVSLPDTLKKESDDISVQTSIVLGNSDFSSGFYDNHSNTNTLEICLKDSVHKLSEASLISREKINSNVLNGRKFDPLNSGLNKYFTLIKSARKVIKMKRDVAKLNGVLNSNARNSLSPKNIDSISSNLFYNNWYINDDQKNNQISNEKKNNEDFGLNRVASKCNLHKNMLEMMQIFLKKYTDSNYQNYVIE